ncbi:MAG: YegS/Rv2252/BmrU family lipid kinase [Clostridia bacterium]|nr:YegS/Rv2252/BmrU family lipid kinase [Clostridia bacterium]MBQ8642817.1 YegS/Rv2252/BmrU family lipid kinase [Clostridia bacterium]
MKQLLLILNPASGTRKAAKNLSEIISVFNRAEYDTHVYVTACRGDAVKAVQQFGTAADLIVCCGGDGTLNETVTGMIRGGFDIPIGYIPSGSTNDFANSLHLSGNVVEAAQQIVSGTPAVYDVGRFGERYFTYIASFGVFTKTSYTTPQNIKNALGHMAYLLEGIQELSGIRAEHIRMELDGETIEDDYLFGAVCNSTSVGGILKLKPDMVDMADGKFEILLVRAPRDAIELHECVMALRGQTYNCGMITFRSAGTVCAAGNPEMPWSLDGERAEGDGKILIENLHKRIMLVH